MVHLNSHPPHKYASGYLILGPRSLVHLETEYLCIRGETEANSQTGKLCTRAFDAIANFSQNPAILNVRIWSGGDAIPEMVLKWEWHQLFTCLSSGDNVVSYL